MGRLDTKAYSGNGNSKFYKLSLGFFINLLFIDWHLLGRFLFQNCNLSTFAFVIFRIRNVLLLFYHLCLTSLFLWIRLLLTKEYNSHHSHFSSVFSNLASSLVEAVLFHNIYAQKYLFFFTF